MAKLPITPSAVPGTMGKSAKTGTWKFTKPVLDPVKCNGCLDCWLLCPDSAIVLAGETVIVRLDFCKGCGICAAECPQGALRMEGV